MFAPKEQRGCGIVRVYGQNTFYDTTTVQQQYCFLLPPAPFHVLSRKNDSQRIIILRGGYRIVLDPRDWTIAPIFTK